MSRDESMIVPILTPKLTDQAATSSHPFAF
jgi:hypothetical protein